MLGPMLEQDVKKDMYQLLATTSDPSAVSFQKKKLIPQI